MSSEPSSSPRAHTDPDAWWELAREAWSRCRGSESYDLLDRMRVELDDLTPDERRPLLELATAAVGGQDEGLAGLALALLEQYGEPRHAAVVHRVARSLASDTPEQEMFLLCFLRVLAARGTDEHQDVVDAYLSRSPPATWHSSLVWALWPHRPEAFAEAEAHFMKETPPERWARTAIVQSFGWHKDAVAPVRRALAGTEALAHLDAALARMGIRDLPEVD